MPYGTQQRPTRRRVSNDTKRRGALSGPSRTPARRRNTGASAAASHATRRAAPASALQFRRVGVAAALLLIILLIGGGIFLATRPSPAGRSADAPKTAEAVDDGLDAAEPEGPTSTPRDEWKKGTVPELFQTDPAWAGESYAGGTIAENGCGVTCMAMVYAALTGKTDRGPAEMASFSEENGYVEGGGTPWRFMTDGGEQLGLTVEVLPNVAGRITDALDAGRPVIVNVGPGTFTTVGHYIVLTENAGDGLVYIHNPNAPEDNANPWELSLIMDEARNYWAFSA